MVQFCMSQSLYKWKHFAWILTCLALCQVKLYNVIFTHVNICRAFPVTQLVKNPPAIHLGSIPGLGRSPGEGKGYSLQYSGLKNSMDYGVQWGLKESDTTEQLSLSLSFHDNMHRYNLFIFIHYTHTSNFKRNSFNDSNVKYKVHYRTVFWTLWERERVG